MASMDPGILAAYQSAASVQSQTGIDPVIVATILTTEGPHSAPYSLGITTLAPGGRGLSGGSLGNSGGTFGGTQPANFWSYQSGAEASMALASYLRTGPPGIQALAPFANDWRKFFAAGPQIFANGLQGNYYVPTAGEASAHGGMQGAVNYYWGQLWGGIAQNIAGASGTFDPSPGGELGGSIGTIPMPGGPTPSGTPRTPGEANPSAFDTHSIFNPNFGPTVAHLLVSGSLIFVGLIILFGGVLLLKGDL